MRTVIPEILSLLGNATGLFRPTPEMARVWEPLLARFSDSELREAAVAVAQRTHYGAPGVGHIVEQIEGRVEHVKVPVTDHWLRVVLRPDGTPVYRVEQRRVYPDGRTEPMQLPPRALPNAVWHEGAKAVGDGIDDTLTRLLDAPRSGGPQ